MSFLFKFIGFLFFIFLLVSLQMSWFLFPRQLSLIFILIIVLFLTGFSSWAWLATIIGGFLLDLYSIFPPGLFCLSLIFSFVIIHKIACKFNITSGKGFFVLGLWSSLVYKANVLLFSYLFYFLKFSDHCVVLNKFYWLDLIWFMTLNASFIFIITLGIKMIKRKTY